MMQQTFDVVRSAGNSTYNYVNPVRRDVVSTGGVGDNVTFRFITSNSGPWFLHWWAFSFLIVICTSSLIHATSDKPHQLSFGSVRDWYSSF